MCTLTIGISEAFFRGAKYITRLQWVKNENRAR
jgi:hypothetical protein